MSIRLKHVSKFYGVQKALDHVSFEIHPGEVVGLLGPNGAGKSTLMKIVTGFLPASEGEVFVKGINVSENSREARKLIGYLPENNPLYPEMYVREYLEFAAEISGITNKKKEKIDRIISLTGLEPEKKKTIGLLSKGFRQRVGLAQALIHDPDVLILDEPTTGLDPNQIVEIRELIRESGREKTVILSTHIMQEVEAICDRVIIIHNGQIRLDGKAAEVSRLLSNSMEVVSVEFDRPVEAEQLKSLPCIQGLTPLSASSWEIEGPQGGKLRESLFQFAVTNQLVVLSMQKKEKKLEDVFRELTGDKNS